FVAVASQPRVLLDQASDRVCEPMVACSLVAGDSPAAVFTKSRAAHRLEEHQVVNDNRLREIALQVEAAGLWYNTTTGQLEVSGGAEADNSLSFRPVDALSMLPGVSKDELCEYLAA